jgi:hypothetical protein
MVKKSNFKTFCLVVLLVAEATQAVTPDTASLASSRLFQIVGAIVERGESWVTPCLPVRYLTIRSEISPPPTGSVPLEDRSQENEPDQVCLASCRLGFQLPGNEAGKSHKSQHVAFDPDKLWVRSGRLGSAYVSDPVPWSCALIHSLCRMTC